MDISVKVRNYCDYSAEVTIKGDSCTLSLETFSIEERVDWSYQLINAAYDVINHMGVTTEDEAIESVHDKLSTCLDELYKIRKTIKKK